MLATIPPANRTAKHCWPWSTASRPAWKSRKGRSTPSCVAVRRGTAAATGSGSKPTTSKSSAACGTARPSAARSLCWCRNNDYKIERMEDLACPRPGHGDLNGSIKHLGSIRGFLERASTRTTARIAAGRWRNNYLAAFGIEVFRLCGCSGRSTSLPGPARSMNGGRCATKANSTPSTPAKTPRSRRFIDGIREQGDTLGGVSRRTSKASLLGLARTRNGTRSSTAGWLRRSCRSRPSRALKSAWVSRPHAIRARSPRSDSIRSRFGRYAFAGFRSADESSRRLGGGHEQRAADRLAPR